jgi:7-cyano-7-deazaguanine reductase
MLTPRTDQLTELGKVQNKPVTAEGLEWFENPLKGGVVDLTIPEFTCNCPKTGQPDFATIKIRYIPADRCVESKSLKLYIWHFRNEGKFHEAVTRQILDDLCGVLNPLWMQVVGDFGVRGGIHEVVSCEHVDLVGPRHGEIEKYRIRL